MILVTGAGGFLGRAVCARLRREDVPCLGIDLEPSSGVEACDVSDSEAVGGVFRKYLPDSVVHLAGILPTASRRDPARATRVNIAGSVNLIQVGAASGVRRFVFGSSMSVYGAVGDGMPVSEETPACPTDVYGAAKRYVEIFGEAAAGSRDFSFVALRIATVVGPGARGTASPWRSEIFERLAGGARRRIPIPFPEPAMLSLVHVEDAARMLVLLAVRENLTRQVYNSPAENWTVGELKRTVEALGCDVTVEPDSTSQRGTPPVANGARFVQDFAWRAPSLAEQLARTVKRA